MVLQHPPYPGYTLYASSFPDDTHDRTCLSTSAPFDKLCELHFRSEYTGQCIHSRKTALVQQLRLSSLLWNVFAQTLDDLSSKIVNLGCRYG